MTDTPTLETLRERIATLLETEGGTLLDLTVEGETLRAVVGGSLVGAPGLPVIREAIFERAARALLGDGARCEVTTSLDG